MGERLLPLIRWLTARFSAQVEYNSIKRELVARDEKQKQYAHADVSQMVVEFTMRAPCFFRLLCL